MYSREREGEGLRGGERECVSKVRQKERERERDRDTENGVRLLWYRIPILLYPYSKRYTRERAHAHMCKRTHAHTH